MPNCENYVYALSLRHGNTNTYRQKYIFEIRKTNLIGFSFYKMCFIKKIYFVKFCIPCFIFPFQNHIFLKYTI